ncbi:MAG: IS66 family insertion sequence element accessory protein TnpA, partial [Vitreimonas sp.]
RWRCRVARDRTRRRMAALVRQWETSGELRRAFAERHGLTISQLDYWKRQVRRDVCADHAVGFARVQVVDPAPLRDGACIDVVLGTGDRVTIHEGASLDLVRAVVTALRPSC